MMPICVKHGDSPRGSDATGAVKNDAAIGSQGVDNSGWQSTALEFFYRDVEGTGDCVLFVFLAGTNVNDQVPVR
jgi:hypothetical protein